MKMPIIKKNHNNYVTYTVGNFRVMSDGIKSCVGYIPVHNLDDTVNGPIIIRELKYPIDPKMLHAHLSVDANNNAIMTLVYEMSFMIDATYQEDCDLDTGTIVFEYLSLKSRRTSSYTSCLENGQGVFISDGNVMHYDKSTKSWS